MLAKTLFTDAAASALDTQRFVQELTAELQELLAPTQPVYLDRQLLQHLFDRWQAVSWLTQAVELRTSARIQLVHFSISVTASDVPSVLSCMAQCCAVLVDTVARVTSLLSRYAANAVAQRLMLLCLRIVPRKSILHVQSNCDFGCVAVFAPVWEQPCGPH